MAATFFGTRGTQRPKYLIVGEAYGREEAMRGAPFVGSSGQELTRILQESKIPLSECLFTNVVNSQPTFNDMKRFFYTTAEAKKEGLEPTRGLFPAFEVKEGLKNLEELIKETKPERIIALGNYPLWALTENCFGIGNVKGYKVPTGIVQWRGSQLRDRYANLPLMPTFHPAGIMRQWANRYPMKFDLSQRLQRDWTPPEYNFLVEPEFYPVVSIIDSLIKECDKGPYEVSVDLETENKLISCVGLAWSEKDAICIPLICQARHEGYWTFEQELVIVKLLRTLLHHKNIQIIGQNFLFDAQYTALWLQVIPYIALDTRIMHHLCWPGTPQALYYLSSLYCKFHTFWKDEGKELYKEGGEHIGWEYNCKDCVITYEVAQVLKTLIKSFNLEEQFKVQQAQLQTLLRMMIRGVKIDRSARINTALELRDTKAQIEERLENLLPVEVYPRKPKASAWYRSPKQLCEIFYDILNMKTIRNPQTHQPTTGDAALHELALREPIIRPVIKLIQEFRSLSIFEDFTMQELDSDGRMRCEYSPTKDTFRSGSSKNVFGGGGNLQNLPKGGKGDD